MALVVATEQVTPAAPWHTDDVPVNCQVATGDAACPEVIGCVAGETCQTCVHAGQGVSCNGSGRCIGNISVGYTGSPVKKEVEGRVGCIGAPVEGGHIIKHA